MWWRGNPTFVFVCQRFVAVLHRGPVTAPSSLPTPGTALRRVLLFTGAITPSVVSIEATVDIFKQG